MLKQYLFSIMVLTLSQSFTLSAQTQAEMNQTAIDDYKKADAELDKVYKEVMEILNEKEKQLIIIAQIDWSKFRNSHCKFEIEQYDGGSIQPLLYYMCLEDRTQKRIAELKAILNDETR